MSKETYQYLKQKLYIQPFIENFHICIFKPKVQIIMIIIEICRKETNVTPNRWV